MYFIKYSSASISQHILLFTYYISNMTCRIALKSHWQELHQYLSTDGAQIRSDVWSVSCVRYFPCMVVPLLYPASSVMCLFTCTNYFTSLTFSFARHKNWLHLRFLIFFRNAHKIRFKHHYGLVRHLLTDMDVILVYEIPRRYVSWLYD